MDIPRSYRKPLFIALLLHVLLILFLVIKLPETHYRLPGHGAQKHPIVQAQAIRAADVQKAIRAIQYRENTKQRLAKAQLNRLHAQAQAAVALKRRAHAQAAAAEAQKQRAAVRVAAMQRQQIALQKLHAKQTATLAALQHQAVLEKRRMLAAQKKWKAAKKQHAHAEQLAALRRKQVAAKARAAKLMAEQRALQHAMLNQQLAGENKRLASMQSAQEEGVINKYNALLLQAIAQQWLVPAGVDKKLKSVFAIDIGPGGVVLSVSLLKSSGDSALDRSAQTAIYKASPLPVPKNPSAFNHFRHLQLTVSPKKLIQT